MLLETLSQGAIGAGTVSDPDGATGRCMIASLTLLEEEVKAVSERNLVGLGVMPAGTQAAGESRGTHLRRLPPTVAGIDLGSEGLRPTVIRMRSVSPLSAASGRRAKVCRSWCGWLPATHYFMPGRGSAATLCRVWFFPMGGVAVFRWPDADSGLESGVNVNRLTEEAEPEAGEGQPPAASTGRRWRSSRPRRWPGS